jgi:hypothetical protein
MVKSKELLVMKTLEAKKEMMETKNKERKQNGACFGRMRAAEENRAMAELIPAENATMNPAEMDEFCL